MTYASNLIPREILRILCQIFKIGKRHLNKSSTFSIGLICINAKHCVKSIHPVCFAFHTIFITISNSKCNSAMVFFWEIPTSLEFAKLRAYHKPFQP